MKSFQSLHVPHNFYSGTTRENRVMINGNYDTGIIFSKNFLF